MSAVAAACLLQPSLAAEVVDSSGRTVDIKDASRVLSIGGDTTEILYALGLGDKIVGVDATSLYPAEAMRKTNVGYMRALSTEGVLSTGATLILATAQAGPPEVMAALKSAPVALVSLPENENRDSLISEIRLVGKAVGAQSQAEELAKSVSAKFDAVDAQRAKIAKPARVIFIMSVTDGRALIAGTGTTADLMIRMSGAENVASKITGYRPLSSEAMIELAPDVIVTMKRPGVDNVAEQIASLAAVQTTPAGKNNKIITMDALYLLGFGPRTPDAAKELMEQFYPDLAK